MKQNSKDIVDNFFIFFNDYSDINYIIEIINYHIDIDNYEKTYLIKLRELDNPPKKSWKRNKEVSFIRENKNVENKKSDKKEKNKKVKEKTFYNKKKN